MSNHRLSTILLSALIAGNAVPSIAQQSDASISPSLSLPATGGTGTLGGLALTLAASPRIALRGSGQLALHNMAVSPLGVTTSWRPWTADVDAIFALAGRPMGSSRTPASYGFLGIGESAIDTANVRATDKNWSYGVGSMVPFGASVDLFAEYRWRVSRFVLPTARPKPTRSKELRIGMTLHMSGRN